MPARVKVEMAMDLQDARIIHNRVLGPGYYKMELECIPSLAGAVPGQFVMILIRDVEGVFWRRPFSVAGLVLEDGKACGIELIYKVVGRATAAMSAMAPGQRVSLLGPLGRGFEVPDESDPLFLAAGGIGIAPLIFLARHLGAGNYPGRIIFFLGGRSKSDLLCLKELEKLNLELHLSTDDGSAGLAGPLTEPLAEAVARDPDGMICACGPPGMLKAVGRIAASCGCRCQVAVETLMACGMGACQGCVLEQAGRQGAYLKVCRDGPVFDASRIIIPG